MKLLTFVYVLAGFLLLLWLLFFGAPIYHAGLSVLPARPMTLERARNYYSVLSAIVSSAVGGIGLVLGLFYYFHKKSWEHNIRSAEKGRSQLQSVLARLEAIEDLVDQILTWDPADPAGLQAHQMSARRRFDSLVISLSEIDDERLDPDGLQDIVRLYSFTEQNLLEANIAPGTTSNSQISIVRDQFRSYGHEAQRACYKAISSLT